MTEWKKQYDFDCPATQPNFEDWTSYYPANDIFGLVDLADSKLKQADQLNSDANYYEKRIGELDEDVKKW